MTDHELIEKTREGDLSAFEKLVKKYEPQVAATVTGMLGRVDEAEDVGQEVFVRFYKSLHRFRGDSTLGTYLTRIAINLSLNALKRRKRRNLLFATPEENQRGIDEMSIDPDESLEQEENRALIHRGLDKLAPEFRSVIVLRLLEGYSTEETAKILDVPQGTVLSRLSRAQKKLREILKPYVEEKV